MSMSLAALFANAFDAAASISSSVLEGCSSFFAVVEAAGALTMEASLREAMLSSAMLLDNVIEFVFFRAVFTTKSIYNSND